MNPIETYDAEIPNEQPAESADVQRRLEDARPFESGADAALSPEARQAMQQGMQGTDAPGMAKPTDVPEGQVIGTPEQDAQYLHKQTGDTCATVAQQGIIEKSTGIDYGEDALNQEAYEKGWVNWKGETDSDKIGNLLESHGISTQRWLDGSADINTLKEQLAQGNDVIVGVDAGEFYEDDVLLGRGHAVWVTGLETDTQGDVSKVIVNDSNAPKPQVHDATHFQNAWNASNRLMIATA